MNMQCSVSYLTRQYVICRVRVADGQKQLIVQSQVIVQNSLSDHLGLEVTVALPETLSQRMIQRPKLLLPPWSSCAVPVFGQHCLHIQHTYPLFRFIIVYCPQYLYISLLMCPLACSDGALSFRPVRWGEARETPRDASMTTSDIQDLQPSTSQDSTEFSWSKDVPLRDLWARIRTIESEPSGLNDSELNIDSLPSDRFYSSGLPKFLPVQTLRSDLMTRSCKFNHSSPSQSISSVSPSTDLLVPFYMALATEWTTCVHRQRSCRQISMIVKAPFRIRSTVPMPIS